MKVLKEIPVLLYHNIGHYPEAAMEDGLHPESFERQMQHLSENGFNVVSLNEAIDHLTGHARLPAKSIAITIDGGYRDAYLNALPVLKKHNFHATFFIVPEHINSETMIKEVPIACLSWDEVHEIAECRMGIGLHAYKGKGIKRQYNEQSIKESIPASLKIMKENFGGDVKLCSFKEGIPEKSLWDFLKIQEFQAVFTQCPTNRRPSLSGIGRIQIDDDDHNIFLTKISPMYLFFKDKRSWKYIRRYKIDRLAHRISETLNRIRGNK